MIAFRQALEISLLSGITGWVVTMLVSLVRAPKLLHDQQLGKIQEGREENERLRKALTDQVSKQTSTFPHVLEVRVRTFISHHPNGKTLLDSLMTDEEWNERQLQCEQDGPALIQSGILKRRLVQTSEPSDLYPAFDSMCSIASQYRPIVSHILYEENA